MTTRTLDVHRVSRESLRAIAAGNPSEVDLRLLSSAQRSQLLLVLRALLDHAGTASHRTRQHDGVPPAERAWRLLCTAQRHAPEAVETVLADPSVMAWALRLLRRLSGSGAPASAPLWADLGQFHALAAAAALRAGVPAVLRVPAHRGMVWIPGAGVAGPVARRRWSEAEVRVGDADAVVRGELTEVRLPRPLAGSAPGWRPLRELLRAAPGPGKEAAAGPWLDTVTPYRDFTQSPKSPGRLAERRLRMWQDRLAGAYVLLERECPADAAALTATVRALVPRSFQTLRGGQVASASSLDAYGAITLSLPYDEVQTAAVLVHEMRHQQLNALLSLVALVRVADDGPAGAGERRLYYAPWRSDPRPVHGLLHGVFAFAGVARFWRVHRRQVTGTEAQRASFEFAVLREQLREAVDALATAEDLTEAGRLFVDENAALVRQWQDDDVPDGPDALARHYCALRRALWRARHLEIPESAAERIATAWTAGRAAPPRPPSVLRSRLESIRLDTFGPLARLRLSAPEHFVRRRKAYGRDPTRRAEYAAVAGDTELAAAGYAEWAAQDPLEPEAWIGAVLILPERTTGPGAALLLDRPEVVAGVRQAVAAAGGGYPDPLQLAAWLGTSGDQPVRTAPHALSARGMESVPGQV
ncbi:HEXXH motif domain-containing protein [Streptomyces sp. UG1]|uniref:HEXXH motif domain-containing protein n=1 Tax=Streptomyces sp. UG1 TaxID=3417652 RepID=UPI003CF9E253